jgi:hypothetical protein
MPSRSAPGRSRRDQAAQVHLIEAIDVLERIDDRKPRIDAKKDGGIAVGVMQVDQ